MISKTLLFLKKIGVKTLLVALKGLGYFKKIIIMILTWTVVKPLWWFGKTVLFSLAVKVYKFFLFLKIRWEKIYTPVKQKIIYPLTRRYISHIIIILIALFSIAGNIYAREASLENIEQIGQKSILFTLSFEEESENFVQEEAKTGGPKTLTYLDDTANLSLSPNARGEWQDELLPLAVSGDDALLNPNLPSTSLNLNQGTKIVEYLVEEGDTISTIAEKFGIKTTTILWANKLSENDLIRPGDKLLILPVDGVLHQVKKNDTLSKIAKFYKADSEKIKEFNILADANDLIVGEYLIVPDGKVPPPPPPAPRPRSKLARDRFGIPPSRIPSGKGMIWPTSGKSITQYFTWRHSGLDIDGDYTSPIYASETGTVKYTGWGRGYGLQIVISHGNGVETRYAHLSKLFVDQGEAVAKGQTIGIMGSTGWSTGTHLHFEIMIGGKRVNPLNYL